MSLVGNGTDAYARATVSAIVNGGQRVAESIWAKWNSSYVSGTFISISAGSANPVLALFTSSGPAWWSVVNGTNTLIGTPANGVWTHVGVGYGPWKDEAIDPTVRVYLNGAFVTSVSLATTLSTADLTRFTLLAGNSGVPNGFWGGRVAEPLIHPVSSDAEMDSIMALCHTQQVTSTALGFTPAWSRRLVDDFTSGHGTGNPTGGGGYSFDGADHPSLSDTAPAGSARRRAAVLIG